MADESKAIASVELHIDEGNVAQALSRAEALANQAAQGARGGGQQGGRQQEPSGYWRPSEEGRWRRPGGGQFASSAESEAAERRYRQQQQTSARSIAGFDEPAARGYAAAPAAKEASTALAEVAVASRQAAKAENELAVTTERSKAQTAGSGGRGFLAQMTEAVTKGSGGYRRYGHIDDESLAGGAARSVPLSLVTGGAFTAAFALQAGLADAVRNAIELDRQMATLKVTVDALGQGNQFPQMRDDLLGISSATGVAGGDVATLAQGFMGLYDNTSQAVSATKDVAQWIEITGENATQAAQEIMTVAQAYGASAQSVTDMNLAIAQQTGRTPQDISAATAGVAPVASLYGISQNQTAGIVAATARGSSLSGEAVGTGLDRILEALPGQINPLRAEGINFTNPSDLSQDLQQLATQLKTLPEANRVAAANLVGGARNLPILAALGNNPQLLNKDYSGTGLTARTAQTVGDTAAESFKRLGTSVSSFVNQIENSGVGVAMTDLANGASGVLRALGDIASIFTKIDSATGDMPGHLLALTVAIVAAAKVIGTIGALKGVGGAAGAGGEAAAAGEGAAAGGLLAKGGGLVAKGAGAVGIESLADAAAVGTAGVAAYAGTTAVLNATFGKAQNVKPSTALTDNAKDFVNNFAKQHQQVLQELAKVGTPQQRQEIEDALKKGDNLDLMKIYNEMMTGGGAGQQVIARSRQQAAAQAITTAGGAVAPQTSWGAFAPQLGQGVLKGVTTAGFSDIPSIQAAVAGGMVTYAQSLKEMDQVIEGTADPVQKVTEALQEFAIESQHAMTAITDATQTAQAIGGLSPQNVPAFTAQQAAGKNLSAADLVTLGTTLATQMSAANDALIQNLGAGGSGAGFGGNLLQLALRGGTSSSVSASLANRVNAADVGQGLPAQFDTSGGAVNTVFSAQQQQSLGQQITARQQAYTQEQVAAAQARQASTEQVAQIQAQGDQAVLSALEQEAAAHPTVDYQAQILQAASKVSADQLAQAQAAVSAAQAWGSYLQALQFQSPIAQAQTAMATANQSAAALGTTVAQLQATPWDQLSDPERQVLQAYATSQSQMFQAINSAAQADVQLIQSENLADPVRSAVASLARLNSEAQQQFGSMSGLISQARAGNQGAVQLLTSINQQTYQVFQSQQQAAQAFNQVQQAQVGITGNAPAVAALALKGAQQQLAAFKAAFPAAANSNNPQFAQLQTAFYNAQNQYLETTISYTENLISEQVSNNQISIGQAIQRLKVLQQRAQAVGNFAEVEQIQTQIQQYINQGNQNAAFNLPSNLNLPTLYEVRRTEGTPTGANYYGNTGTVNVSINISNQVDVQPAVNKLMQAVGGPPTTGLSLPL